MTEISKSDANPSNKERAALRRVLKRANYATSDMQAADGPERHEEVVIIRRINAGMVASADYPPSLWRRQRPDPDALASWENEGGSTSAHVAGSCSLSGSENDLA